MVKGLKVNILTLIIRQKKKYFNSFVKLNYFLVNLRFHSSLQKFVKDSYLNYTNKTNKSTAIRNSKRLNEVEIYNKICAILQRH